MEKKKSEIEKLNMCCFWLIRECLFSTNAKKMTVTQEKVHDNSGNPIGDWKITVEKLN